VSGITGDWGDRMVMMTDEDFVEILKRMMNEEGANMLSIPGVYELVSEYYNNDIIDEWLSRNNERESGAYE
jgi:hypothetical protein